MKHGSKGMMLEKSIFRVEVKIILKTTENIKYEDHVHCFLHLPWFGALRVQS